MAKKSFKGGLDSILSGSKIDQHQEFVENQDTKKNEPISDQEKHFLQKKNERLLKELHLWRTGKLNLESFNESLKVKGLKYNPDKNIIY